MKRVVFALIALFACSVAYPQVETDIDRLLSKPFIKAEFRKERKLKVLSKPFITYGYMLYKPDKGLIWKTTRPIDDTIMITGTEITSLNDTTSSAAQGMSNPIANSASEMFLTIMSRDKQKILKMFDYEKQPATNNATSYRLTPKDEKLAAIITYITISGQDRVESIDVLEKSGDSTSIYLLNEIFAPENLNAVEMSLYERI